ncbi:DUF3857 domain-containing protein [Flagellimonas sp.]|uniref:DUF3857 domain-containing protein n=1 Tax=Flagellimonas sp. TaxID=2058762 RepID=UPI003F4A618D
MRQPYFLFPLLLLFFVTNTFSQSIPKKQAPDWVVSVDVTDTSTDNSGAFQYILLDFQDNIALKELHAHYAIKVLNSEGIQQFSDISVSFDPSFQKLEFNTIYVHRDGKKIDKLANSRIMSIQRETNLERSLYDGSLTGVVNLTDIRKGDIIEYSYTIKGFNPINKGHYSSVLYQQYTLPVNKIFNRVITNNNRPVFYKLLNGAAEPKIDKTSNGTEYVWESVGMDYFQYDINVPYWLNLQKRISITTFKDWESVVDLINPLYQNSNSTLNFSMDKTLEKENKILKLIRFVQDEVRYLGFESGIGAYKPNNPRKVLEQRYGDCKDKSLLLVNLLRNEGLTSYPYLVSTDSKNDSNELLPGLNLFNHCIVYFEYLGKTFYVDPTITNQGGNLENLSFPKYGKGLLLKKNTDSLSSIVKNSTRPSLKISETIITDSIGGGAIFLIESTYAGSRANSIRDYFNSNTEENINKEFINFYSSIYPSIQSTQPVRFTDDSREGKNEVIVEEYYEIPSFWVKDETGQFTCETQPMVLESMIEYTQSPSREMPYYLGEPYDFEQETTLRLPEYWDTSDHKFEIDEESFSYHNEIRTVGKTIKVKHNYSLKKNILDADDVTLFLEKHDKINNQIAYQLSHPGTSSDSSDTNWFSYVVSFLIVIFSVFIIKLIYEKYNPQPKSEHEGLSIGGWLILPAIGLVLSPFIMLFQLVNLGYFDAGVWSVFESSGYEGSTLMTVFLFMEFVFNLCFFMYVILLLILFFKKRSSFPNLVIGFYALNFLFPILDLVGYSFIFPEELQDSNMETYKEIARGLVSAAIWIPYFLISERVKNTFVNLYQPDKPSPKLSPSQPNS